MVVCIAIVRPMGHPPPDDEIDPFYRNGAKAGILTQWQRPKIYDLFYPCFGEKAAE